MRRSRKTYERPFKRWDKARILEEARLVRIYGLKNKRELWKAKAIVRKFRRMARRLFADPTGKEELFAKLRKYGLIPEKNATLDDVLGLKVEDVLERRLQTVVYRKGLARTIKQARQFIVHRHIAIGDRIVTVPGYLVTKEEEKHIRIADSSPLSSKDHPVWKIEKEKATQEKAEEAAGKEATSSNEGVSEGGKEEKA